MTNSSEIFIRILLTVIFGAILGLETETRHEASKIKAHDKNTIGGIRTYTILSLFGGIAGILYINAETNFVYLIFAALIALIIVAYLENIRLKGAFGMTTEIAILITFILGFFTTSNLIPIELNLFILVILAFFLSQKRGFSYMLNKFSHIEIIDVFKFGLVSIVILPLLPNQTFYINDVVEIFKLENLQNTFSRDILNISLINPFRIWLIVVIISGINLLGYLLTKIVGTKPGIFITAVIGGIVSSTSTTLALANRSKENSRSSGTILAGAAIISNAISLISVLILLIVLSLELTLEVYKPLLAMFILGLFTGLFFIIISEGNHTEKIEIKHTPFSIIPALKFVIVVILLTLIIQILQLINNEELAIIVTAFSGIIGLDAPTIAISELIEKSSIAMNIAVITFLATNAVNFMSKGIVGITMGSNEFRNKLIIGLIITLLGTLVIFI